jgi:glycosyltransferase involved in cell wall biosynthesis
MVFDLHGDDPRVQARANLAAALNPRAGETVCIATPHLDQPGWNYTESLVRMFAYDKAHGNHLLHNSGLLNNGSYCPIWGRSTELSHARNTGAAAFLSSESDWLLWWDSDIGAEPDALERLLEVADPVERPIVGGLAFIEGEYSHDGRGGLGSSLSPTLYDWTWAEPKSGMPGAYKMLPRDRWEPGEVTRVGATGTGFLLTHRTVYEKISRWLVENEAPPHIWFERIPGPDGERCGEDISFCMRAHQLDMPVYVHTGVTTTHQKTIWYGTGDYAMKPFTPAASTIVLPPEQWPKLAINPNAVADAARNSPMGEKQVPEATEEVAIIVPVAQRDNAEPFLRSLMASITKEQRERLVVYVMADVGDVVTDEAWMQWAGLPYPRQFFDANRYLRTMGSFAEKVNRGFEISTEPWLFLVGDDVRFHKGWLDQAMEVARTTGKHVIGTNDLGNEMVKAGRHATHMLIRREYVKHTGASWDGPGVVCHEGYRHWFVDNEIVEAARQVDAWAPCLLSHVEHLHPLFGKGTFDSVYQIGQDAANADAELWRSRWARYRDPEVLVGANGAAMRIYKIENEGE